MKWITADGEELEVKEMTSYHALNCVNYLLKQYGGNLVLELILRGKEKENTTEKEKEIEFEKNGFKDIEKDFIELL